MPTQSKPPPILPRHYNPLADTFAFLLFDVGIIRTGLPAISASTRTELLPCLGSGCGDGCVAEFRWARPGSGTFLSARSPLEPNPLAS